MPSTRHAPPLPPNAALRWHMVRHHLDQVEPATVLELGAGQGRVGALLAERASYVGVEPDPVSRAAAGERLPDSARLLADIGELDPAETFDLACSFEVLEHIPDDVAALRTWVTHVRPGGHVLVSVPADPERFSAHDELVGHIRRYGRENLAGLFEAAGLEVVAVEHYGYPLGDVLETGRNAIASRRLRKDAVASTDIETRTAGSGRHLQPPEWAGAAIWYATGPFRAVQTRFPDRGRGLVGLARRPG